MVQSVQPVRPVHISVVGSVADRATVRAAIGDHRIEAVIHSGGLHQPDMDRRPKSDFIDVNIIGTLNLLDEAVAQGILADHGFLPPP